MAQIPMLLATAKSLTLFHSKIKNTENNRVLKNKYKKYDLKRNKAASNFQRRVVSPHT
jgi:hypothetical protein